MSCFFAFGVDVQLLNVKMSKSLPHSHSESLLSYQWSFQQDLLRHGRFGEAPLVFSIWWFILIDWHQLPLRTSALIPSETSLQPAVSAVNHNDLRCQGYTFAPSLAIASIILFLAPLASGVSSDSRTDRLDSSGGGSCRQIARPEVDYNIEESSQRSEYMACITMSG